MKIIISPAKKINLKNDYLYKTTYPKYLDKANELYDYLKTFSIEDIISIYKCSKDIAIKTYDNIHHYDINNGFLNALFTFDGIQYKGLSPNTLDSDSLDYLDQHLLILSGLYGSLKPFDLIIPYRLEMGFNLPKFSMYEYWKDLYKDFIDEDYIINLCSNEYSHTIIPFIDEDKVINITFLNDNKIKSTYAKKARGAMVRYMAINKINDPKLLVNFNDLNYHYDIDKSNDKHLVFSEVK